MNQSITLEGLGKDLGETQSRVNEVNRVAQEDQADLSGGQK